MDALELLTQRSSMPRLIAPGPDPEALAIIKKAALRVPDHMNLTPYRCQLFSGDDRADLGRAFATAAAREEAFTDRDKERAAQLPLRAPLIVVVSTCFQEHQMVPFIEQAASAACAAFAMQQACFALGYGAIWRSGHYAQSALVKKALGVRDEDEIMAFLYVGTPAVPTPIKPEKTKSIFSRGKVDI
ncbi:nitroreductase [Aliidiomarina minuta]|uniref:Putative NAD(P)H nitroreductase n=1 Tax=Aliidiomarina minuta TaxID=880057 RepID=A0A432W6K4_9GAMM|nr:nitroreductase family protein [Aliidiomarina minuta]RUO25651.1 nitroreductase [Aliidiomarina minuta]